MNGAPGAEGPPGAMPPANISGIIPATGYLAREMTLTISGTGTTWSASTSIDFGNTDIKVKSIIAPSPTALEVTIDIAANAMTGPRNVTVKDNTSGETQYLGGFDVEPPITMTALGNMQQGSIALLDFVVKDLTTPLDTSTSTDAAGNTTYPNLNMNLPAGVSLQGIQRASDFQLQALISIDVNTSTAKSADLDLVSGPPGDAAVDVHFPLPAAIGVGPRSATTLKSGTAAMGNITTAFDSDLYTFAPGTSALTILDFDAASMVTGAGPAFALLPKSGQFAGLLAFTNAFTMLSSSTDPYYAIYWDNTGTTGAYTMTATATAPGATAPTTSSDGTKAGAVVATKLPFVLTNGMFTGYSSMDWVQVTTGASDGGKTLVAQTVGDQFTDTSLTIYDATGTNVLAQNDTGGLVTTSLPKIKASTVYYVVFAPGFFFSPTDNTYDGVIRIQ